MSQSEVEERRYMVRKKDDPLNLQVGSANIL